MPPPCAELAPPSKQIPCTTYVLRTYEIEYIQVFKDPKEDHFIETFRHSAQTLICSRSVEKAFAGIHSESSALQAQVKDEGDELTELGSKLGEGVKNLHTAADAVKSGTEAEGRGYVVRTTRVFACMGIRGGTSLNKACPPPPNAPPLGGIRGGGQVLFKLRIEFLLYIKIKTYINTRKYVRKF